MTQIISVLFLNALITSVSNVIVVTDSGVCFFRDGWSIQLSKLISLKLPLCLANVHLGTDMRTMVHSTVKVNHFKVATWSDVCLFRNGYADNGPFKCQSLPV
jgi:hypothetical protein